MDFFKYRVKEELYDYVNDPHALKNLIGYAEYNDIIKSLRVQMYRYMKQCQDGLVDNFYRNVVIENGLEECIN